MSQHVLIVEDEPKIARLLRDYLEHAGYRCSVLARGDQVADFLQRHTADLLLLDLQLPGKNGLEVCRDLRPHFALPVIMVTARVDEIDRLLGLELGADDYICKPFSPREVVARVKAVLRRTLPSALPSGLQLGRLRLDSPARQARLDDQVLTLTPVEFDLLELFLQRPREVLSRAQLLQRARGNAFEGYERNIDTHVKNLRKKLRARLDDRDPFRTAYGHGYALNPEAFVDTP